MTAVDTPDFYTAAEAADVLRVTPRTIQRLVKEGVLARVPHLRHIVISRDELIRFGSEGRS